MAALLATALVLSGCGADKASKSSAKPSVSLPTGNVKVPEGTTLTKPGTELAFGKPATVAYEPNSTRGSVVQLTVGSVRQGRIKDLSAYQLDARTKTSTPYYVRVAVKNVGPDDLSRAPVPLYAVDTRNTLIQSSSFNNTFKACPSTPLPAGFTPGKSTTGCLVYLVPRGGTLVEMSYRPLQDVEPIVWKGTITPPPAEKAPATSKKKSSKKKGQP